MAGTAQTQNTQVFQAHSIQLAHRAFNLVIKYVFNEDKANRMSTNMSSSIMPSTNNDDKDAESKAWGRSMKSAVVFDLAYRDFDLAMQKEPKNLFILIWYAICVHWNTRYVTNSERIKILDAKATQLFGEAVSNCKVNVIAGNSRDRFLNRLFLPTASSATTSAITTMSNITSVISSFTLSKADILAIWAHVLHRESAYREGWIASIMLQSAVEKAQAAYELHPDKNNQYSSIFILWHKILIDQEKVITTLKS